MKSIADIDKNFKINTTISEKDIVFFDAKEKPFDLYGVSWDKGEGKFIRIPKELAENTNEGVALLYTNTAGGRIRFKTDSPYVAISVKYPGISPSANMSLSGTAGFDMFVYEDGAYTYQSDRDFAPDYPKEEGEYFFSSIHYFDDAKLRDITINFPLYNNVSELYIGIKEGSVLESGGKYINDKPIVYYGSSITQGGCASRPGNSYQAMVSRYFNCDYINLGFSGSARGEDCMADYIADLDMCCFVYDYDHNAPEPEHLLKTHKKMFDKIRSKNPDLPIIMMTAVLCKVWKGDEQARRRDIIKATYDAAIASGDKNVYLIDSSDMFGEHNDIALVDGIHPNDFGFLCMAERVKSEIKKAMKW